MINILYLSNNMVEYCFLNVNAQLYGGRPLLKNGTSSSLDVSDKIRANVVTLSLPDQ